VVDKELGEVRQGTDPSDAEQPAGGPDRIRATSHPNSLRRTNLTLRRFGEPLERPRKDNADAGDQIALTQHDMAARS